METLPFLKLIQVRYNKHPRASGSGSFLLAVIYTGTTKMPHFVIFEATFSKFSGN